MNLSWIKELLISGNKKTNGSREKIEAEELKKWAKDQVAKMAQLRGKLVL